MDQLVAFAAESPWLVAAAVVALIVTLALLRVIVGVLIAGAGLVALSILIGHAPLALVAFAGIGLGLALLLRTRTTVGILLAAAVLPFAAEALRTIPVLDELGFTGVGLADSMLALAVGAVAGIVVRPLFGRRPPRAEAGHYSQPAYPHPPLAR